MKSAYLEPFRDRLKRRLFIALVLLILIYGIFRIFNYYYGPKITIEYPKPYQIIDTPSVQVRGVVKNAKTILLNGREINIDQNGNFSEEIVAKSPYTLIILDAIDKYGKKREKVITIGKD